MEENDVLYLTVTSQKCCGNYTRDCARLSCWEIYVDINLFVSERKVRSEGCLWNRFPKTCGSWELAWSVMKSHLLHSSCYILNKFNCWIMDVFISGMLSHQIVRPVWVRRLWQLRDCTPPQEQQVAIKALVLQNIISNTKKLYLKGQHLWLHKCQLWWHDCQLQARGQLGGKVSGKIYKI